MRPGLRERGPDRGRTVARDGKGEYGVQEETRRGNSGNGQDDRDHDGTGQYMERLPVQHVGLQVEHGGPDPHRRQDLDQGQPPVGEQQLHAVKQHGQGTDRQSEGSEPPPRTAQPYYRLFYGRTVVVADGLNELPDPGRQVPPRPGRLAVASPWPRVQARSVVLRGHRRWQFGRIPFGCHCGMPLREQSSLGRPRPGRRGSTATGL